MNNIISKYKSSIDNKLNELLSSKKHFVVNDAMNYSVSIGGKRIRPCILLEFARINGGNMNDALKLSCALECIHTYSLIHDDLPCMDNDDMRRGMPSCHIKFREDTALLAGDALLTEAFNIASSCSNSKHENILKCINILSEYSGYKGMIGGQELDCKEDKTNLNIDDLIEIYTLKTGRLLQAAAVMGCVISGADNEKVNAAKEYALNLGIAFQIVDDILDVVADESTLGKPTGSDTQNGKKTFVDILGVEGAKKEAEKYTNNAIESLKCFNNNSDLIELTKELCYREF